MNFEKKVEYLNKLKVYNSYWKEINIDDNSKFLTLATCSYLSNDSRMLVVGIKK